MSDSFTVFDLESSQGYQDLSPEDQSLATSRFVKEYGNDDAISYLPELTQSKAFLDQDEDTQTELLNSYQNRYGIEQEDNSSFAGGLYEAGRDVVTKGAEALGLDSLADATRREGYGENDSGYDIIGGAKDIFHLFQDLPEQTMAAVANAFDSDYMFEEDDWKDRFRKVGKDLEESRKKTDTGSDKKIFPLPKFLSEEGAITRGTVQKTRESAGFSVGSMGASLATGLPALAAGPGAMAVAGMAGGGKFAFNANRTMVTIELLESAERALKEAGKPRMTKAERKELLDVTADIRRNHSLWEAGSEAVGNALAMTGIGGIANGVFKGLAGKVIKGVLKTYGGEIATETVTQMGQQRSEVDLGLSNEAKRKWADPEAWGKSLQEVAPSTIVLSSIGAGGGAVAGAGMRVIKPKPIAETAAATDEIDLSDPEAAAEAFDEIDPTDPLDSSLGQDINPEDSPLNDYVNAQAETIFAGYEPAEDTMSEEDSEKHYRDINKKEAADWKAWDASKEADKVISETEKAAKEFTPSRTSPKPKKGVDAGQQKIRQQFQDLSVKAKAYQSKLDAFTLANKERAEGIKNGTIGVENLTDEEYALHLEAKLINDEQAIITESYKKQFDQKPTPAKDNEYTPEEGPEPDPIKRGVKAEREIYKNAVSMAEENPHKKSMTAAVAAGGINIEDAKQYFSKETVNDLQRKHHTLFQKNGTPIDEFAQENGYASSNALVDAWANTGTKKEEIAQYVEQGQQEWDNAQAEQEATGETEREEDIQQGDIVNAVLDSENPATGYQETDTDTDNGTGQHIPVETVDNADSVAHGQEIDTDPTEAQIEAENYKKAHVRLDGMEVTIENPTGSKRSGTDEEGNAWSQEMKNDYGYIRGSVGYDKDHVDVFFANGYEGGADKVHIVNQFNKDGSFDEQKSIIGANGTVAAKRLYNSNYEKGWAGGKSVVEMPMEDFKIWVKSEAPQKGEVKKDYKKYFAAGEEESNDIKPIKSSLNNRISAPNLVSNKVDIISSKKEQKRKLKVPTVLNDTGSAESPVIKNVSNPGTLNSKDTSDTSKRAALSPQTDSSFKTPRKTIKPVDSVVVGLGSDKKVGDAIIKPVPVEMVDDLTNLELSSDKILDNKPVLKTLSPDTIYGDTNKPVTSIVFRKTSDVSSGTRSAHDKTTIEKDEVEPTVTSQSANVNKKTIDEEIETISDDDLDSMLGIEPEDAGTAEQKKIMFSKVEDDLKDMIAIHNLSEENLVYSDKAGGLPVPSIGISGKGNTLTGFGDVSLIAPTEMFDPGKSKQNKVFAGDAYTPRYPNVEKKVDNKSFNTIEYLIVFSSEKAGFNDSIAKSNVERDGIRPVMESAGMKAAYLDSINAIPKLKRKKYETPYTGYNPKLKKYAGKSRYELSKSEDFKSQAKISLQNKAEAKGLDRNYFVGEDGNISRHSLDAIVYEVEGNKSRYINDSIANRTAIVRIAGQKKHVEGFSEFVNRSTSDLISGNNIFTGYTDAGRRKYIPATMDNIVKIMSKKTRGEEGFNYGLNSVKANVTPSLTSLKDIRENKWRLKHGEEFQDAWDDLNSRFEDLNEHYNDGSYQSGFDEFVADVAKRGTHVKKEWSGYEDIDTKKLTDFLAELRDMPSEYFEAKVNRAVRINEFVGAVVPKGTSKEAIDTLKKNGIKKIKYYNKGDETSRAEAIGKFTEAMFSKATTAISKAKPADIQSEIKAAIGDKNFRNITKSFLEIITPEQAKEKITGTDIDTTKVEGFTLTENGKSKSYLVSGNIAEGKAYETLLHEIGHAYLPEAFKGERWNELVEMFDSLASKDNDTGRAIRAARKRVPADTPEQYRSEEQIAYYLTLRANQEQSLYRKIMSHIKSVLMKLGLPVSMLHPDDIVVITKGYLIKPPAVDANINEFAQPAKMSISEGERVFEFDTIIDDVELLYPVINEKVDELNVSDHIPNIDSIDATLDNYEAISGIRELPFSDFNGAGVPTKRIKDLGEAIEKSGEINPLIVIVDEKGPYVLEGSHRFDALQHIGKKTFPALVIVDTVEDTDIRYSKTQADKDLTSDMESVSPGSKNLFTGTSDFITRTMEKADPKWGNRWERFLYNLTDIHDPIRQTMKAAGPQEAKTDILTSARLRGKITAAEVERFSEDDVQPILKELAEGNVAIPEFEEYKYALHVPERNLQMKRVNAKLQIDKLLKQMTDKEAGPWKSKLMTVRSDALMDNKSLAEKHDMYLEKLDEIFLDIGSRQKELDAKQTELFRREWTDEETAKGTDVLLQKRLDKAKDRLARTEDMKAEWEERSPRLSGITDKEAKTILKKWNADEKIEVMKSASTKLDDINNGKLKVLRDSGQISKEEYKSTKSLYKHYVPLYRDGFDDGKPVTGRVTGPTGKPLKVAMGSMREVVNILAHTVQNYESAVNNKHKADAGRVLYNFANENPDSGITIEEGEKKPTHDKEGNLVMYTDVSEPQNGIFVKIDGERFTIVFDTDSRTPRGKTLGRFLESIKDSDSGLGTTMQFLTSINRKLAMINTMLSPEFLVSNFVRDAQTAGIHMEETKAKGMQKKIVKDLFPAIKGIFQSEYGNDSSEMGGWYRDFAKHGAKIGWLQGYENVGDLASELESSMNLYKKGHTTKKSLKALVDLISKSNVAVENGVRLAVYKSLVESGEAKAQAALAASNLTVDFTRHGKMGPKLNALYMFANAGIQGNVRMIKAVSRSKKVQAIVAGISATGFMMHMLALSMGGDDETGEPYIDGIDDFVKERNMIFFLPGGKGRYKKIPMPYGYNGFYNMGAEIADMFSSLASGKEYSVSHGAMKVFTTFANSFNPLAAGTVIQTFSPTILDPVAQAQEELTWSGGSLMPSQPTFGPKKPDSQRYWSSVSAPSKYIAQTLNSLTKGDVYEGGAIDISPETLDMLYETVTGSLGKFVVNTLSLPSRILSDEPVPTNKIPFYRRFAGEQSEYAIGKRYRKEIEEIGIFKQRFDDSKDLARKRNLAKDPLYAKMKLSKKYEKRIRDLRKRKRGYSEAGNERSVKLINKEIRYVQTDFLKVSGK